MTMLCDLNSVPTCCSVGYRLLIFEVIIRYRRSANGEGLFNSDM